MDEAEGDGVGTNAERTPFLGDGFGKTNNRRLGSSIVGLTDVSMKAGGRRDADDGTVLRVTLTLREHCGENTKTRKRHIP